MLEEFDITTLDKTKEYIVDVMECTVERPKVQEIQREYYSGKKIVYVAFDKESVHDFALFKDSTYSSKCSFAAQR